MGAPRRGPGEEHILKAAPLRRRAVAVQMIEPKRRKHQQVSMAVAQCARQRLRGALEVPGGPAAQPIEIASQMRGRRIGDEIVVVDSRRQSSSTAKGTRPARASRR